MEDGNLFADIDLMDLIPLIIIGAVEGSPNHTNVPIASAESVLSGADFLRELLECGNDKRIYRVLRMKGDTFKQLCQWFKKRELLQNSRNVAVEQQVAQFLWIINYSASIESTAERFRISKEPTSRYFHQVLQAMLSLYNDVVNLPNINTPLASRVANDPKYMPYFADCLGALDGTHIDVHVTPTDQPRYRNRKGHLSQNVLAVCDFDMHFKYVLAGWEGSAHDSAVVRDAKIQQGFITPPGKYWLGDAGYANTDTILVPYRKVRYHLKEQRLAAKKPENAKELFNLRHASLRNVIERIFGVVKRKYQILRTPSEYSMDTQTRIILACCALHNYVRSIEGDKADIWLQIEAHTVEDIQPAVAFPHGPVSSNIMDQFRDDIAKKMWEDYQGYLRG